jgi:Fic family protein
MSEKETIRGFAPIFMITNRITAGLTLIERARGFLEAASLSEMWLREMGSRALILEAHHTTHIEGTRLSRDQAERLLAGDPVPDADPDDVRELLNYRKAFDFVSEYLEDGGPVTEGLVREIHKRLVQGVRGGSAAPGAYREVQNYVVNSTTGAVIYTPPPAHEVPLLMSDLVDWINREKELHPVLVSGIAQFQLVHVHPFLDGNGRTSRLLSTLCLYRTGYDFKRLFSLSEHYDRDRATFYSAIQSVRANDMDMTGWLEYFVDGLRDQLNEVKQRGEQAIRKDQLVHKFRLSSRQAGIIEHILEHGSLTIHELEGIDPKVNRRTLQRDLKSLVDNGLLFTEGATNQLVYRLKT